MTVKPEENIVTSLLHVYFLSTRTIDSEMLIDKLVELTDEEFVTTKDAALMCWHGKAKKSLEAIFDIALKRRGNTGNNEKCHE